MASRPRACDRCADLKYQCSEDTPCTRCRRLELECTRTRPVRPRGRPRKSFVTNRRPTTPSSSSSIAASSFTRLLLPPQQLPVDAAIAADILDHVLRNVHRTGFLAILRRNHHKVVDMHPGDPYFTFVNSPSVQCVLLSCGFLLDPGRDNSDTLAENCRIHALSDIPILTWKSRPINEGHIYSLCALANLGYLYHETTAMADRWAALASCLYSLNPRPSGTENPEWYEMHRRLSWLLNINNNVQTLLYNRLRTDENVPNLLDKEDASRACSVFGSPGSTYVSFTDREWHHFPSTDAIHDEYGHTAMDICPSEGFFDLFNPLQAALKIALSSSGINSSAYAVALEHLEEYFISFPTRLMKFEMITLPWHFEAMIWFHSIHILLNVGPDFLKVLLHSELLTNPCYVHAMDHAILLGDILRALPRSDTILHFSHATIFFIALSATLHSSLLRIAELTRCEVLFESASAHKDVLMAILQDVRTCDHPLIQSTLEVLTLNVNRVLESVDFEDATLFGLVERLKYYRWIPDGLGLIKLDDDLATEMFRETLRHFDGNSTFASLPAQIESILDPTSRICRSDTFDLSILY